MTRRDRWSASDYVTVRIDSHHDHQTAHYFYVNAAGVQRDLLFFNNTDADLNWDAVWEANSQLTTNGWTAEFKIPYSALRFTASDQYTWGVDFTRYIARNDESARWQFVPTSDGGGVSRYGHLEGVKGIEPSGKLETLPYFVSYGTSEPSSEGNANGRDFNTNMGIDIKYPLTSSIKIDATINPDFGQVESDGAIINLGTYETYFHEKRPFFLEGSELFEVPEFNLFYSRRIGRAPRGWADSVDYAIDYPANTTILNAVKLSGKTNSGTSIGILNATTQEEKMTFRKEGDLSGSTHSAVVEPMANYTVARVKQDIFGSSYLGGMLTYANQKGEENAYTATTDCRLYFVDQKYRLTGVATHTNNGPGTNGFASYGQFQKVGGPNYRWMVSADYYDDNANWNRLGYLTRNGYWGFLTWHQLRSNKEFGPFRYLRLSSTWVTNKHLSTEEHPDGYRLWNSLGFNGNVGFTNNWWMWTGITFSGREYDDLETRGNILWHQEKETRGYIGFNTDQSKKVNYELNFNYGDRRGGKRTAYFAWVNFKPLTNLEFSFGTGYEIVNDADYWLGEDTENGLPVFGALDNRELDFDSRGTFTFNKNLTLQWYAQFYFSAGQYDNYRHLTNPELFASVPDSEIDNVDFSRGDYNYKSLRGNLILRWEYLPGSALFVVWTHDRDGYDTDFGDFDFSRDMDALFESPATNSFLIKANYWWNL